MRATKIKDFERIYEASAFSRELEGLFAGDSAGHVRYAKWLAAQLQILDRNNGPLVPGNRRFEKLITKGVSIYSIREKRKKNTRVLYYHYRDGILVLLTAFDEKGKGDYSHHIDVAQKRAQSLEIQEEEK